MDNLEQVKKFSETINKVKEEGYEVIWIIKT